MQALQVISTLLLKRLANSECGGFVVATDLFLSTRDKQIVALVAQRALPTIYAWRANAIAGGLISYGQTFLTGFGSSASTVGTS